MDTLRKLLEINERLERIENMLSRSSSEDIIDVSKASEVTGYKTTYLYKLTSENQIPHYKHGKKLYFRRSELMEWMLEQKIKTIDEINAEAESYCASN